MSMPHQVDIKKWCPMFYLERQILSIFLKLVEFIAPILTSNAAGEGAFSLCKLGLAANTY